MASKVQKENLQIPDDDTISQQLKRQGSIRKVLPGVRDADTQLSMSAKIIDRKTLSPRCSSTFGSYFLEYSLLAEFNLLTRQKLPGAYVVPSEKSPLQWFGVLFIHQGWYEGGVFKFTIHIPCDYPDGDCPRIVFEKPVFHPLVNAETGELDVQRGFQKWRRNVNHLWHLIVYMRRCFYKLDCSNPVNSEAAFLFQSDEALFNFKVHESISNCTASAVEESNINQENPIRFSEWDPKVHQALYAKLTNPKADCDLSSMENRTKGLSWVKKDTLETFTGNSGAS